MSLIGSNLPRQRLGNFDAQTGSLVLDVTSAVLAALIGESVWMARPGHTVFTAMPSRTAQYPRAPRPLTPYYWLSGKIVFTSLLEQLS